MLTGMFIVFSFLALLVLAVDLLKILVQRYFPVQPTGQQEVVSVTANDSRIIAAITAAVTQYRNKHH